MLCARKAVAPVVAVAVAVDIKIMTGPAILKRKAPVPLLTSLHNQLQLMGPIPTPNMVVTKTTSRCGINP